MGRRILITGAAGGVGHATAELLAAEGASVALADIRADALEAAHIKGIVHSDVMSTPMAIATGTPAVMAARKLPSSAGVIQDSRVWVRYRADRARCSRAASF